MHRFPIHQAPRKKHLLSIRTLWCRQIKVYRLTMATLDIARHATPTSAYFIHRLRFWVSNIDSFNSTASNSSAWRLVETETNVGYRGPSVLRPELGFHCFYQEVMNHQRVIVAHSTPRELKFTKRRQMRGRWALPGYC